MNTLPQTQRHPQDLATAKYLLSHNCVKFAPANYIYAIEAHTKEEKLAATSIFISSILGRCDFGIMSESKPPQTIIYYCTADEDYSIFCTMLQMLDTKQSKHFHIINLQNYNKSMRLQYIMQDMAHYRPTHIFIDGLKVFCQDFNSQEESTELIEILAQSATKYQCGIWCVLHLNPNNEKMRGHLGTELENKAADIFYTSKDNDHFVLRHEASRHQEIDDILFRIENPKGRRAEVPVPCLKVTPTCIRH